MRKLALFLFCCSSLFSAPFYELDPLVSIHDCVHAFNGDLYLYYEDQLTENIVMQRVYREEKWSFFPHTTLILHSKVQEKKGKKKKKKKEDLLNYPSATVADPNGCVLTYFLKGENLYILDLPKGLTNTAKGIINAKTNLKNQCLKRLDTFTFLLTCPDGTKRTYQKAYAQGRDFYFLLQSEELPNGHIRSYEYDQENRVHAIRCGKENCVFHYHSHLDFDLKTNTGITMQYRSTDGLLQSVRGNGYFEDYEYRGTCLQKMDMKGETFYIEYTHDQKVHVIKNVAKEPLYSFSYSSNQTAVTRKNGEKTVYTYAASFLPETIVQPTQTIEFMWNKNGELLSKITYNKQKKVLDSQKIDYDTRGNPIYENQNGKETFRDFDSLNRVIKETSDKVYSYTYLGNTDLVATKITQEGDRFFYTYGEQGLEHVRIDKGENSFSKREIFIEGGPLWPKKIFEKENGRLLRSTHYQYFSNEVIEEIRNPDDTLCLKHAIPKTAVKRPWEEVYSVGVFFEDGFEIEKDSFGRVIAKRKRDEAGNLLLEEMWSYDALHLLTYKDPMGLITHFAYNEKGQKEKETFITEQGNKTTFFSYDALGRLNKVLTENRQTFYCYNENHQFVSYKEEDLDGNLISQIHFQYEKEKLFVSKKMTCQTISPPFDKEEIKKVDPSGVHRFYNAFQQLTELYTEDGSVHYTIEYNIQGLPIHIIDHVNHVEEQRIYDDYGKLIEETFFNGQTIKNSYDMYGRRTEFLLPDESSLSYQWGARDLEEILRIPQNGHAPYRYHFTKQHLNEGFLELSSTFQHNISITKASPPHSIQNFENYTYQRDGLGRIVKIEKPHQIITFTYDVWNRRQTKRIKECKEGKWVETHYWAFLYDHKQEIGVIDLHTHALIQLRICPPHPMSPGNNTLIYEFQGIPYLPILDGYGNIHKLLSPNGEEIKTYSFWSLTPTKQAWD